MLNKNKSTNITFFKDMQSHSRQFQRRPSLSKPNIESLPYILPEGSLPVYYLSYRRPAWSFEG